ncbi:MAG: peptide chain release factor 1 [Chlamydiales bacterium]|nr:peptide chain release factor 1 [Chlamydiales bacterium]
MEDKVLKLIDKLSTIEELLGQPDTILDKKKYKELTREHSYLLEVKETWQQYMLAKKQLEENKQLLKSESDIEFLSIIQEEITKLEKIVPALYSQIETLLVPPDPNDNKSTIIELRAGTGGDEAAIFVGDCVRMYQLYAAAKGWSCELLSCAPSDLGGFKEYIMVISGQNVHRLMQYEAGTHRVQRVPDTETQGRVHTSAVTVAILIEPDEEEQIEIDERDLKIDTYRSSGAGGQHVNTTDSAVRITHLPTNTVVYCQEERSQHKNKDKALRLLTAKIAEQQRLKKQQEISSLRASQVGSGDRSERIRTYNFPQNRLTDHRVNLTLYNLDRVMQGDLDEVTNTLVSYFHQQKLENAVS